MIDTIDIFNSTTNMLKALSIRIQAVDMDRPWGGFMVIEDEDANLFVDTFFPLIDKKELLGKISPKILLVAPNKKLSWQYHHHRSEIWKLIDGEAGIIRSFTDQESPLSILLLNEVITLQQGERHRLVGLNKWGIVAEIWLHTNPNQPSDENDIVRIQDDFGRK